MDDKRDRESVNTINYYDFQIGDLVIICDHAMVLDISDVIPNRKRIYGIIVEDVRNNLSSFFPQLAIYVLKKQCVEFHWPSYLKIVSPA